NSAGTVTSANATLTVNPLVVAPSITTQPASQSVTAGSGATFSVVASGTAPLTYQWRFNAANIAGATASSYSLANAQAANAGAYSVVIGNSAGTVTSVNATLTVTPAPVAPSITTQPASQTITAGSGATFNVAAGGTAPLNYQWRFNGANISGATAAAYVLTNAQAANAGSYSVVVSNSAGTVTSVTATLTVNPAPIAPSITTPPASQSVVAGANVSFSVVAAGTGPLTYQWRFNNANIAGATTSTYNLNNCQTANAGNYSCLVSNIAGSVTSAAAVLAVSAAPVAPSITTPPATQTVTAGANVNFTVAASGTAPLFYQWLFNNAPLAGKTSSTLALSNVQAADAGAYSVLVSNSVGSVTSVAATLTVNPAPIAPTITTQPAPQTILAGNSISCSVVATGTGPLTYQWRFNNANIAGATSSTYNLANAQASNAGSYSVIVGNAAGSVTSVTTVVTVNIPPSITMQPATQTVALGANVNFSVTTAGTGPLSYQWSHSGTPIAGATSSALALTGVQTTDSGAYAVTVTSAYGAATSSSATLTVNLPTPPTIAASPASQTVSVGTSVSFTVTASGTGPLSYQWRFNGADIAGSTSATLTIASAQTTAAGSYDVVVNNTAGTATSAAATLTIVAGSPATAGVYQGLFYDTNGVAMASSGYFTVAVAANGSFTAALRAGADRIKFKGMFDAAGRVVATGLGKRKLSVSMQISQEGLTGSVTDGQWIATVQGDRNGFDPASNPAPFAGAYGLVVPQAATLQDAGADTEHDATTGSVTVDVRGGVRFAGTLLNNLKATQTTALSKNGNWPFYVVLPRHQGIAIGWINFDGTAPAVATGTLLWLQPTDPAGGGTEFPVQVRVAHHDD
ncbi:MAG: immunoglobulin domain-containing protein, partial [Verrucomicrobiota bacterium]